MEEKHLKTGTTTVGLTTKDSVVLAADMRASMGHLAYDEEVTKIYKITDNVALTIAGSVGDALALVRYLRSHAKLFEIERETKITPKAVASLLSNVLNGNRYYPFIFQPILAGVNNKPELFELTPYGGIMEKMNYALTGSGTTFAMTTLDREWKKGLTEKEAIDLAIRAVKSSTHRDIYSGGDSITVAVIDDKGYREIDSSEVEKIMKTVRLN